MRKKQFKSESQKLLDLMINSIYTHKEIFLRELISNASDASDKLYFHSLTDNSVAMTREDFEINIEVDKENRTLKISDIGCGMTMDDLEKNLGTIAKSGTLAFKQQLESNSELDVIGQFGVGFYSSFMVSDKVVVESKAFGEENAYRWTSSGTDGYFIEQCDKQTTGTDITLYIKKNTEQENYDEFLEGYKISQIVKKYSDYIRYPIKMDFETSKLKEGTKDEYETVVENRTLNSMVPLWRKNKSEISDEDYNNFYQEKFYDFEKPIKVIHSKTEGQVTYNSLLFFPKRPPFDYYAKDYEKGLQLYSNGVLIMEKCPDLLPDYYSFVKGLVDSADLSLNISREVLQHDYQLKLIAKTIEKKITNELLKMQENQREEYEEFFNAFGIQIKFGIYNNYGLHKDTLKDLLLFYSSSEKKPTTLKEYVARMKEGQDTIYYACGDTVDKIDMLPQTFAVKDKGYEVLYLTDNVDEFAIQALMEYEGKKFANICADNLNLETEDEKKEIEKENKSSKDLLEFMKETIGDSIKEVRFTNKLKSHPVCLTSEGNISLEMEKVINSMPTDNKIKAEIVLEINSDHEIANKLKETFKTDKDSVANFTKVLYNQARLISGMAIENPTELCNLVCDLMV